EPAVGDASRASQCAVQLADRVAGVGLESPAADRGRNRGGERARFGRRELLATRLFQGRLFLHAPRDVALEPAQTLVAAALLVAREDRSIAVPHAVEDRFEPVIIALRDWVEFVIV